MNNKQLCQWLRENSGGFWPAAMAAIIIEQQQAVSDGLAKALRGMLGVSGFGRGFQAVEDAERAAYAALAEYYTKDKSS